MEGRTARGSCSFRAPKRLSKAADIETPALLLASARGELTFIIPVLYVDERFVEMEQDLLAQYVRRVCSLLRL